MLKTKLLSVFVAFALIITVGGVYATWSYAGSNLADIAAPGSLSITATISEAEVLGAPGTLAIDSNDLAYEVVNAGDYEAELVSNGSFTISYTPNDGTDHDTVNVQVKVILNQQAYTPSATNRIFDFSSADKTTNPDSGNLQLILTKNNVSNGAGAWTITYDELGVIFADTYVLDSVAAHNAFAQALRGTHLEIDVSVITLQ